MVLFEAEPRLGGHAHTHDVPTPDGGMVAVDTGFIVHNDRTYPNLLRLFGELGVVTQPTEMSMSVRCAGCGLEYAGAKGLPGLFPRMDNLRPTYLWMLGEVLRFHRHARRVLADDTLDDVTLGAFLAIGGYSQYFVQHYVLPVVSAVWSAGPQVSREYPARYLFAFLDNHGMLSVTGSPQWRSVVGGSRTYVELAAKNLSAVHVSTPVRTVVTHNEGVEIRDDSGQSHHVDRVVIATHPDHALAMLAEPTQQQREVLGAFTYSRNETWLHTDAALLPTTTGASASWNYLKTACHENDGPVVVSYHMNRLMRLAEPLDYVVTLNATGRIPEQAVIAKMTYEHPVYTPASVAAQRKLPGLNTDRIAFAGAYHGWGFHEDGCVSGVRAAKALGVTW